MTRASAACLAVFSLLLHGQEGPQVSIEQVGKGFTFLEGPAWSKDGFLLFSDGPNDKILKLVPGQDVAIFREKSNGASGNAFDPQGRLYTCETRARRVTRTDKAGKIDVLAERFEGKRFNAPNDLTVSKNDHVYFTDPAFGEQSDHRELDFYGVYHLTPKNEVKLVAKPSGRPNGIALSPNGRTLYVANTDERNIRAYDVDRNGDTSNERILVSNVGSLAYGLHLNDKGDLYLATAKGIAIYGSDGHLIRLVEMHDRPSNCVFSEDGRYLFITARGALYRLHFDGKEN